MLPPLDFFSARILIVDDQAANVALLEQLLNLAGYTNLTATMNPLDVCELHRRHNYDLILLDLQMPQMSGFEVMEALKTDIDDDYLPVIVLTAQPAHKINALQAGAKDFISKPFDILEIQTRIHNMLEVRLLYKQLADYNRHLEEKVRERSEELRISEARFRRLTELASDWYWEQNAQGNLVNTSDYVLGILGASTVEEQATGTWNPQDYAHFTDILATHESFMDFTFVRVFNGKLQYFRISGEPVFDQAGNFNGYRGIGTEYTNAPATID